MRCAMGCPIDTATGRTPSLGADVVVDLLLPALRTREVDIDFRVVNALGVLIELGTSGAPPDALHLRNVQEQPFGDGAKAAQFRKRDAGVVLEVEEDRAFVELRQERTRQQVGTEAGCQHGDCDKAEQQALMAECPLQEPGVARLQAAEHEAVPVPLRPRKEIVGEHRRER